MNRFMRLKKIGIFLLLISLSGIRISVAQQLKQCLAIITELTGNVLLKKVNKVDFEKAFWGNELIEGDQVKTAERSGVKLLFSNSTFISLGPNSTISISGNKELAAESTGKIIKMSSAMPVNLSTLTSNRNGTKDVGALAFLRSGDGEQTIELTSPCNTLIKTNRPSFSWFAKKFSGTYIVNLYSSNGLVWSKKLSDSTMVYPENEKGLVFGESYFWYVEREKGTEKSAFQKFSLLSPEMSRKVEEQEKLISDSFRDEPESSSLHSVLGAYYIDQGLLLDAIREFQMISNINADAPLPHEILGSLYSNVGNKDKAIEELKKALELTANSNK